MRITETTFTDTLTEDQIGDGVIKRVRILGRESKNGRTYSEQAMDDAARLYEGAEVNINHPQGKTEAAALSRGIEESFGELRGIVREKDGVFGDLYYLKSHPMAEQVVERAKRFPTKVGLSHNVEGEVSTKGGKKFVESIRRVFSVDVVSRPATNSTLFESEDQMSKSTVREMLGRLFPSRHRKVLRELEAAAGMSGDTAVADAPVEVPSDADADGEIKAAFRAMVIAAFDDESLDAKATLAKIKDILNAQEKLMAKPESDGGEGSGGETSGGESTSESVSLRRVKALEEKLARKDAEIECRSILESEGVECTEARLQAMISVGSDLRRDLAKSWKGAGVTVTRERPSQSAPLHEQLGGEPVGNLPKWSDNKGFVNSITH